MNENCNYNKTRLLSDLSSMIWRVEKCYLSDAEKAKHPLCASACKDLVVDLKKHKDKMRAAIEGLSREGKFQ